MPSKIAKEVLHLPTTLDTTAQNFWRRSWQLPSTFHPALPGCKVHRESEKANRTSSPAHADTWPTVKQKLSVGPKSFPPAWKTGHFSPEGAKQRQKAASRHSRARPKNAGGPGVSANVARGPICWPCPILSLPLPLGGLAPPLAPSPGHAPPCWFAELFKGRQSCGGCAAIPCHTPQTRQPELSFLVSTLSRLSHATPVATHPWGMVGMRGIITWSAKTELIPVPAAYRGVSPGA